MARLLYLGGLLLALPFIALSVVLYDQWFSVPGMPTIPQTWWQFVLMLVIPGILLGYWLLERYYDWRLGNTDSRWPDEEA
jgi:hypothetical protein